MYLFVYITTSDEDEAKKVGKKLLEKNLIACANIFPITSMFWWKDKIEESPECVLVAKTKSERFKELKEEVLKVHSYETPCIVAFAIEDGLRDFLEWIDESTQER
ncbi:MAG: divalent-cation tolerance protein CutA [Archaeoglobaceae archaeon]